MNINDSLVKSRVKLLKSSPFFGTLLLNAKHVITDRIPTAATDGDILMLNEEFMMSQTHEGFTAILLHEVLHMALEHVSRMKDLFVIDPITSNVAADIVVNGIIKDNGIALPDGAVTDNKLKHLSVREIYSILKQKQQKDKNYLAKKYGDGGKKGDKNSPGVNQCLQPEGSGDQEQDGQGNGDQSDPQNGSGSGQQKAKTNWKDVMNKANVIARTKNAGPTGAGIKRILDEFLEPTINWRDVLYRYITACKTDFEGFDRRMVHQGMYLDDLGGGSIKVALFMDTSGSVDEKLLSEFFAEIKFACNALPGTTGEMWYFDTELYPEGDIQEIGVPKIRGGGGTDFAPAMKMMQKMHEENMNNQVIGIMFTDGYASMTNWEVPECPILWCISPGGVESDQFHCGEVIRIVR